MSKIVRSRPAMLYHLGNHTICCNQNEKQNIPCINIIITIDVLKSLEIQRCVIPILRIVLNKIFEISICSLTHKAFYVIIPLICRVCSYENGTLPLLFIKFYKWTMQIETKWYYGHGMVIIVYIKCYFAGMTYSSQYL